MQDNQIELNPNSEDTHVFPSPFGDQIPPTLPSRPTYLGQVFQFKFNGNASEYFGIWFVNILLTIVTVSLYAPWAKVRRLRYFYSHTEFFDRAFDFTGLPKKILIGRLIALGLYFVLVGLAQVEPTYGFIAFLLVYFAIPWLLRATIRFTTRNSKFTNTRFYFAGTTKEAYIQFLKAIGITIFTLGIFSPVAIWIYKRYLINNLYAGQLQFKLNNNWSDYMAAVYIPMFMAWGVGAVFGIFGFFIFNSSGLQGLSNLAPLIFLFYFFILGVIGPLIQARIFITTWNSTTLSQSQFKTDANQWRFTWIVATNWIAKIFSLGLATPWAAIRLYQYQIESLSLVLEDDPNEMFNLAQTDHSAIAEEISDIFDLDISL